MSLDIPPPLEQRPSWPDGHDEARAELEGKFTATPMYATLGISLDAWGPGWARLSMTPSPALRNLAGTVHGGAGFTLADAAFEIACNSWGRLSVALETTCHYHRPVPVGERVIADGWEVARGGRTATYRLALSLEDGTLLASYLALAYRTSTWHVPAAQLPEGWS